jgi:DNA-binding response OmpR family regulator
MHKPVGARSAGESGYKEKQGIRSTTAMPKQPSHILVVNDTKELLEAFQTLLEDEGYQVSVYSYAPDDLAQVQQVNPDLVILDLIFGEEKSGWQLLDKLRITRATAKIPVIVCTAAVHEVRESEGYFKAMGVTVILKPFDIDRMLETIRDVLSRAPESPTIDA